MKKIIIIFIIINLLNSCRGKATDKIIIIKSYKDYIGNDLQKGLCRYYYTAYDGFDGYIEFIDSCNKYNIGDTIIGKARR